MKWTPTKMEPGETRRWQVGPFSLWVARTRDEWRTAIERGDEQSAEAWAEPVDPQPDVSWTRWAAVEGDFVFRLAPVLPAAPVIVRPEAPFIFPAGSDLTFFVSIPVWIRLASGDVNDTLLREEPTVILSNSFFGDPTTGQVGYALKTTARRNAAELRIGPHLAACPIHIRNQSKDTVAFERLCVYTRHLGIWAGNERLWTGTVDVSFRGGAEPEVTSYLAQTPGAAGASDMITPPREPVQHSIFKKHMATVKSLLAT